MQLTIMMRRGSVSAAVAVAALLASSVSAGPFGLLGSKGQDAGSGALPENSTSENVGGRDVLLHFPAKLPATGSRALVVVLHGGMGNALRIATRQSESALNMDAVADREGFIVVYLNGTAATRLSQLKALAWNAGGGCCGQAAEKDIDDVSYIVTAVRDLAKRYGIDPRRIYGMGHSNGAMMTARLICETDLYAAAVIFSGTLNIQTTRCPSANGKRILAVHGADDQNVPVNGGVGSKGISKVSYTSQAYSRTTFSASGADFQQLLLPGVDHKMENIDKFIVQSQGITASEKAAQFFGLAPLPRTKQPRQP
jgi:polyhydroxybutyrate depolymerase